MITVCAEDLAANIAQDCANPIVAGFTGRGVLIDATLIGAASVNGTNPRKIESFGLQASDKVCAIDDIYETPFEGTQLALNTDSGLKSFQKTLGVHVPVRGADASKNIIEPLLKSRSGFVAVLERKDRVGDGSYVVYGFKSALKGTDVTQDETANGSAFMVTLQCDEQWAELTLAPTPGTGETDYTAAKAAFEALWAKSL